MSVRLVDYELRWLRLQTRLPFRYGITTMTNVPHLVVRASVQAEGRTVTGTAAESLAPKWFTKDPGTSADDDVAAMLTVIDAALGWARAAPPSASPFQLWLDLDRAMALHAREGLLEVPGTGDGGCPPLLWGLGVSLAERAVLDAYCQAVGLTIAAAVRQDALGIALGSIYPELAGTRPADWLPPQPQSAIRIRHTVGLGDALTAADIAAADRVDDGLPQSLDDVIEAGGIRLLKIKLSGNVTTDRTRLHRISEIAPTSLDGFTLDGNEQFSSAGQFRVYWERLQADHAIQAFCSAGLLFVEQPIARALAISDDARASLADWPGHPPIIIDESDDRAGRLLDALGSGYSGTSHKNCKGVFRGIANACLISRRARHGGEKLIMSGEDLANVGPVALLQDLAVVALLGLEHAERNGHHFFRGVSMFPAAVQDCLIRQHGDLYQQDQDGTVRLQVRDGQIALGSVVSAPFGSRCGPCLDAIPLLPPRPTEGVPA